MWTKTTYWLKSMHNIISVVSSGRLVINKIWLGGCSGIALIDGGAVCGNDGAFGADGLICGGALKGKKKLKKNKFTETNASLGGSGDVEYFADNGKDY